MRDLQNQIVAVCVCGRVCVTFVYAQQCTGKVATDSAS